MSDCCSDNKKSEQHPKRHVCPNNGNSYFEVPFETVLHHIKQPWEFALKEQAYYFCEDPNCDVVYFGVDNSIVKKEQLRTIVGIKVPAEDALICYCFGVSKAQAKTNNQAKAFVLKQTKNSTCSCATYNPSGRCCLKDFPKQV